MSAKALEFLGQLKESLEIVASASGQERDVLAAYLYTPSGKIREKLDELDAYSRKKKPSLKETQAAGQLMEQIVLLAFTGLLGWNTVKSYSSPGPQYDLLINGSGPLWQHVCTYLRIDLEKRGILVEAKATSGVVGDPTFARLCAVIRDNVSNIVSLGVFVTMKGASGFPTKDAKRQGALLDSRLRQVLFHAHHGTPIVVFTMDDLQELDEPGALIQLLERKVADISELSGKEIAKCDVACDVDLPTHLKSLYDEIQNQAAQATPPTQAVPADPSSGGAVRKAMQGPKAKPLPPGLPASGVKRPAS